MEGELRKYYDDTADNRHITTVDLFDPTKMPATRFHLVFCLDCSGSMGGAPWQEVTAAYQQMLARRRSDQGLADLVTAIPFDDSAHTCCSAQSIHSAPQHLTYHGGGTNFAPALQEAHRAMLSGPADATPLLIFMSDGENGDHGQALSAMGGLASALSARNLQVHTVAFRTTGGSLQQLAAQGGGQFHACQSGVDLSSTFVQIAAGCNAVDGLVARFAEKLSEAISIKVLVDYL